MGPVGPSARQGPAWGSGVHSPGQVNPGFSEPKALKREMAAPRFEPRSWSCIYSLIVLIRLFNM